MKIVNLKYHWQIKYYLKCIFCQERANSSEEMLDNDSHVTLLETAKEKLKGAVQAGLVTRGEAAARTAVVRTAALLHEADRRAARRRAEKVPSCYYSNHVRVVSNVLQPHCNNNTRSGATLCENESFHTNHLLPSTSICRRSHIANTAQRKRATTRCGSCKTSLNN